MFNSLLLGVILGFGVWQDLPVSKLISACVDNRLSDVMAALNDGAQFDEPDEDGFTCVEIAKRMGYSELWEALKKNIYSDASSSV